MGTTGQILTSTAERHHGRSYLLSKLKGEDGTANSHASHRRRRVEATGATASRTATSSSGAGSGKALALGYEVMHVRDDGDEGGSSISLSYTRRS